jgi:hypothetical protein
MIDEVTLEQRLAALEKAVTEIKRHLGLAPVSGNWVENLPGKITDLEAFEKVLEYGRAFRYADRPPDEPEEQS